MRDSCEGVVVSLKAQHFLLVENDPHEAALLANAFVAIPDKRVTVAVLMNTDLVGAIRDPMDVARLFAEPILAGSRDAC